MVETTTRNSGSHYGWIVQMNYPARLMFAERGDAGISCLQS